MVKAAAAAGAALIGLPLLIMLLAAADPAQATFPGGLTSPPSALAAADIPPGYLASYRAAAPTCQGLPWSVLAGIGKVESDHGRSTAPGVRSGANSAGAEGPMQFLPQTFARYAVAADPDHPASPYDAADAIYTAAKMLCGNGAESGTSAGVQRAVYAYNHAWWYVADVLSWAARYTAGTIEAASAAAAISYAQAQLGKPYCWGGQGPSCYDCSGLVFAAYAAAGIRIARTTHQWQQDGPQIPLSQIQPGDLLFSAGSDGTPQDPGHVVMYLGDGQVIQAPQSGEDVQVDPVDLASVITATRPADLIEAP